MEKLKAKHRGLSGNAAQEQPKQGAEKQSARRSRERGATEARMDDWPTTQSVAGSTDSGEGDGCRKPRCRVQGAGGGQRSKAT